MAANKNTPVPPKPLKNQGEQKPVDAVEAAEAEKTPEPEQAEKQTRTAGTVTVRTIGVPGGRRFRAGIEFTSTPREIDLSTLNDLQRSAIESDPHLKID